MLLSERPSTTSGFNQPVSPASVVEVGNPIANHGCDCQECTDVTPPADLLFVTQSKPLFADWEDLCPQSQIMAADITVHWSPQGGDNKVAAKEAATDMMDKLAPSISQEERQDYVQTLTDYFVEYATFVQDHLDESYLTTLKARIVASRGPTGTKCPLWHIDNVPIRWIQALVGPGCEFVTNPEGVNWDAWRDNRILRKSFPTLHDTNHYRVPSDKTAGVYKAKPQEVAFLRGERWNECRKDDGPRIFPVVHRSPSCIPPQQGRLLLTQDVVLEHND